MTRYLGYVIKGSRRHGYQVLNGDNVIGTCSTLSEATLIAIMRFYYGL